MATAALVLLGVLFGMLAGLLVSGTIAITSADVEDLEREMGRVLPGRWPIAGRARRNAE